MPSEKRWKSILFYCIGISRSSVPVSICELSVLYREKKETWKDIFVILDDECREVLTFLNHIS